MKEFAKCSTCGIWLSVPKGTTSTLIRHAKTHNKIGVDDPSQPILKGFFLIIRFVIIDRIVENTFITFQFTHLTFFIKFKILSFNVLKSQSLLKRRYLKPE